MRRATIPLKMLKIGMRHVRDDGDGFYSKSRWVVEEINESGIISRFDYYDYEKKLFYITEDRWTTYKGMNVVHVDLDENPGFNENDPDFIAWNEKYSELNLKHNNELEDQRKKHDDDRYRLRLSHKEEIGAIC